MSGGKMLACVIAMLLGLCVALVPIIAVATLVCMALGVIKL